MFDFRLIMEEHEDKYLRDLACGGFLDFGLRLL